MHSDINKENVRPGSSNKFGQPKKSFNMVGAPLLRPEEMLSS